MICQAQEEEGASQLNANNVRLRVTKTIGIMLQETILKNLRWMSRDSLAVQWLGLCVSKAGGVWV